MDYVTVSSAGNATDFGDMIDERGSGASFSNGTNDRGILYAGYEGFTYNTPFERIEYITISTPSNGTAFGDANMVQPGYNPNGVAALSGTSNDTNDRGIKMGGTEPAPQGKVKSIDYLTITSLGDSVTFGELTTETSGIACISNGKGERGLGGGGTISGTDTNVIEYITISNLGDAADFGDLTEARHWHGGCSNAAV
jgi:hypothetical protein